jgi:putative ABC transport system permease protein
VEDVHLPDTLMVDELYLGALGVSGVGDEVEILGQRAVVRGITQGVRSFTASPFVFTSIKSGRKYQKQYADDEVTYVIARCAPGYAPEAVRDTVLERIAGVDCLTSEEFAALTMEYWMLETGAGITVVVTALLGFVVSGVVISQTLYTITQDHLADYAALLALGFSRGQLSRIVLIQSGALGLGGASLGGAAYAAAARALVRTPLPLETTPEIFTGLILALLTFCLLASFMAVRAIFRLDPGEVFRA